MELCIITPEFIPIWGGVGSYIIELIKSLPKDINIHVVTPLRKQMGKEKISLYDYDLSNYFNKNINVHLMSNAKDTFVYNVFFQLSYLKNIKKIISDHKIDVIHYGSQIPEMIEFRNLGVPSVTTIHTTIQGQRNGTKLTRTSFSNYDFSEKATLINYPFLNFAEIIYFLKNRNYITVSEWMKKQLLNKYKIEQSQIHVIHNSVDTKVYATDRSIDHDKNIILFTGRMIATKGIIFLIKAMPHIIKKYPDALFQFIGPGDNLMYENIIKNMKISKKNYSFFGYLNHRNDLIKYYQSSSVFIAPSLYENLPIRVLEAMACGLPIVASNISAMSEAVINSLNGILTRPGSVNDIVNAISHLLSNPDLRKKMGENSRKIILSKFDSKINAKKTANLYKSLIEK